ncbi:MAG: hypothetical protein QOI35_4032 [Cryptosporangiaceae bacterium]|jgi:hypothetical protein|nr:hypothetical protein [Cryptosporangiaceae bacterium]
MTASRRDPHLGELAAALVDGMLDHGARDRALAHLTRCDGCRSDVDAQRRIKAQLSGLGGLGVPQGLSTRLRALPDRSPAAGPTELPHDRFGARFRAGARPRPYGRAVEGPLTIAGAAELSPIPFAPGHPEAVFPSGPLAGPVPGGLGAASPSRPVAVATRPAGRAPAPRGGPAVRRGPGRRALSRRGIAATAAGGIAAFALTFAAVAAAGGSDDLKPVAPPVGTFTVEHSRVTGGAPGPGPEVGAADAAVTKR